MKLFAWILLLSSLVQPLNKAGVYVWFQANRAYIAANLCESRELPSASCAGTCYLKKELAMDGENRQQAPRQERHSVDQVLFVQELATMPVAAQPVTKQAFANYLQRRYDSPVLGLLKPPCLVVGEVMLMC